MGKLIILDDNGSATDIFGSPVALPECQRLFLLDFKLKNNMLANFSIAETGGTGVVTLQGSTDGGATWNDIQTGITLIGGSKTVGDGDNININTAVYTPGNSYKFRLVDSAGLPISNEVDYKVTEITDYAAGTGVIDFTNSGGDYWSIDFHIAPTTIQSLTGAVIVDYQANVFFNAEGSGGTSEVILENSTQSTDFSKAVGGNGAGVYFALCNYNLSNGLAFAISRLVKVDGAGNVLAEVYSTGTTVNSASGLNMNLTANFTQAGVSYSPFWIAIETSNAAIVGNGTTTGVILPNDTQFVCYTFQWDAVFADFQHDYFMSTSLVVA